MIDDFKGLNQRSPWYAFVMMLAMFSLAGVPPILDAAGITTLPARTHELKVEDWDRLTERIAFWVDLDDAYRTLDPGYVESVWWALSQIHAKGLLYEGHKVVPYCPRCGTALSSHEVALGYEDVVDPSVYVRFPVTAPVGPLEPDDALLVWTTTPWTLVSNHFAAVHPEQHVMSYALGVVRLRRRLRQLGAWPRCVGRES